MSKGAKISILLFSLACMTLFVFYKSGAFGKESAKRGYIVKTIGPPMVDASLRALPAQASSPRYLTPSTSTTSWTWTLSSSSG